MKDLKCSISSRNLEDSSNSRLHLGNIKGSDIIDDKINQNFSGGEKEAFLNIFGAKSSNPQQLSRFLFTSANFDNIREILSIEYKNEESWSLKHSPELELRCSYSLSVSLFGDRFFISSPELSYLNRFQLPGDKRLVNIRFFYHSQISLTNIFELLP
jgi:hypothetical protein